uniref:Rx N-terminal domain-containing protein n=1 Tax=Fagus sylvatica TaxID=28930 RepID=A0A2N9GFL1_FAGSY
MAHSPTMAEGLVTDLIKQLASIAVREAEQEIRLVIGVDEEVQKLKDSLRTVKAVLNDAEKRQVTEEAVKLWLEKLKDACYEMDDVVDEWNTAMIKSEIQDEEENAENAPVVKKKVCSFIPSPSCCFRQVDKLVVQVYKLVLRHDIAHKIKELNGKLDEIVRERREDDLVSILLGKGSEEERSPHVISLVGMGGIGKTTLAQLAYNDPEEKKFFLVLDDVWTEDSTLWEPFRLALKNRRKIAFLDRDPNQCEQLEDLGRKIAKKCKGLPLAAKTLGSLMRFQRSREEWEMVLDSKFVGIRRRWKSC